MTKEIALKDLVLEEIKAEEYDKNSIADYLMMKNVPQDIKNYMLKLYDITENIGGDMVKIGKIIVVKIIKFVKANPNMLIGMALGAVAGVLASLFVGWIPFIGQLLTSLAIAAGVFIGAISGKRVDDLEKGKQLDNTIAGVFGDAIVVAKKFFTLIIDIITTIKNSK
jgi:outer membrane lipoprotein SlyB